MKWTMTMEETMNPRFKSVLCETVVIPMCGLTIKFKGQATRDIVVCCASVSEQRNCKLGIKAIYLIKNALAAFIDCALLLYIMSVSCWSFLWLALGNWSNSYEF